MTRDLLPHRPPIDEPERGTRVLELGTGEAAAVCKLLSTETATAILSTLSEEPAVASEIAEAVDVSIQGVDYHLTKLQEAGLVRAVGTWISSRGAEMTVYAPADARIVVTADAGTQRREENGPECREESGTERREESSVECSEEALAERREEALAERAPPLAGGGD